MSKYAMGYDDPYKILADFLIVRDEPSNIVRVMYDDAYILNRLVKEVRNQDIRGRFLDCIIEDILENKKRMEYMEKLDALAKYYFSKLDKNRLRTEIINSLKETGIDISDMIT